MSGIVDNLPQVIAELRAEQKDLMARIVSLETTTAILGTERKHTVDQVGAIREDVKGLRTDFSRVGWTVIGTILIAIVTFAMKGGFNGVAP